MCALIGSIFFAKSASADPPAAAIQSAPFAAPAAVLGIGNPYLIQAAVGTPEAQGFTFSRDLLDFVAQVDKLARFGVDLNQRKLVRDEKLRLRVRGRLGGGVLQLCYQR
ncbi:MAG: hypothetical protein AMJ62_12740 [Myxococcales bacterium SG8_38]|nr:MAG: hypothetical protein AMJ62_12740 [Myxococcales bacterium SG8_38]